MFSKIKQKKKIFSGLVMAIIVSVAVISPFPFGAKVASAHCNIGLPSVPTAIEAKALLINLGAGILGFKTAPDDVFEIRDCVKGILYASLSLFSWLLWAAGALLNFVLYITIIKFNDIIKGVGAIKTSWTVIRDLANMGFIFILIYTGIKTILGFGSPGTLIKNLVIAALFINFSFFITQVVIDTSNIVSYHFYKEIAPGGTGANAADNGLSNEIMQSLKVITVYDTGKVGYNSQATEALAREGGLSDYSIIIGLFAAHIFILITAAIFLVASGMFIMRFISLIILLIFSPLAFASLVFPKVSGGDFWKKLISQALFAPIFFIMLWMVMLIIRSKGLATLTAADASATFGNGFNGNIAQMAMLTLNFGIIIMFLLIALKQAKATGGQTANGVTKAAGAAVFGTLGFAGRNTVGRLSRKLADTELAGRLRTSMGGRIITSTLDKGARSTFDARNTKTAGFVSGKTGVDLGKASTTGYATTFDNKVKRKQDLIKAAGGATRQTAKDIRIQSKKLILAQRRANDPSLSQPDKDSAKRDAANASIELNRLTREKKKETKGAQNRMAAKMASSRSFIGGRWLISQTSKKAGSEFIKAAPESTDDQFKALVKQKDTVINNAIAAGNRTLVASTVNGLTPRQVKELDNDTLAKPEVAAVLTPADLGAIQSANDLTGTQRQAIGTIIHTRSRTEANMLSYLGGPAGNYWPR